MLDIRLLRTDPEAVARNLARRGFTMDVDFVRDLEERRRKVQVAADEVRAARNAHAKSVGRSQTPGESPGFDLRGIPEFRTLPGDPTDYFIAATLAS